MNIGERILAQGISIRGHVVRDSLPVMLSIIKSKVHAAQRRDVVHTAKQVVMTTDKAQIHSAKAEIAGSSLFADEMKRLNVIKKQQDHKVQLGTKHLRKKHHITTHAKVELNEFTFAEAMTVTNNHELKKLGRVRSSFDNWSQRATNK